MKYANWIETVPKGVWGIISQLEFFLNEDLQGLKPENWLRTLRPG